MYFRSERYILAEGKADAFAAFFVRQLLPIRERYGARLVGRWQTTDEAEVLTIWAYPSREAAEESDNLVADDPATAEAEAFQERYLEPLYLEREDAPLYSTVLLERTLLGPVWAQGSAG